jgi:2-octaprenyl-6-methoxyphenol hydroxylase
LVGEAAHVIPPIGAQGLNLGLRDAATLAEEAANAGPGTDPGADAVLERYAARRQSDIVSRTIAVDLLNRSLISGFLPLHLFRGAGLHLVEMFPWLRQLVMHEGMQPASLPRLMRAG